MCIPIGYYIAEKNVPFYPLACTSPKLADKESFSTLVRLVATYNKMGQAFLELCRHYGWRRLSLLTLDTGHCQAGGEAIRHELKQGGLSLTEWVRTGTQLEDSDLEGHLRGLSRRSRGKV